MCVPFLSHFPSSDLTPTSPGFAENNFAIDSLQHIISLLNAMDTHGFTLLTSLNLSGRNSRMKDLWIFAGSSDDNNANNVLSLPPPTSFNLSRPINRRHSSFVSYYSLECNVVIYNNITLITHHPGPHASFFRQRTPNTRSRTYALPIGLRCSVQQWSQWSFSTRFLFISHRS